MAEQQQQAAQQGQGAQAQQQGQQAANNGQAQQQNGQQSQQQSQGQQSQQQNGQQQQQAAFSDNWRQALAGDNADDLKTLERFASPTALWHSNKALRQKMSSGELKANVPFPDKGTPEEQNAWRKEGGIPEKPEAYEVKLPDGVVLGDEDKVLVDGFKTSAHAAHMRPEHVNAALGAFFAERERRAAARHDADEDYRTTGTDELRAEWGQDYRKNVNHIDALLNTAPEGVKNALLGARGGDGKPLASNPNVLRFLVDMARQVNPLSTVVPGGGANIATSIADEITGIEKFMRENRTAYNKDEKKQARLRELYGARDQLEQKGKKAA